MWQLDGDVPSLEAAMAQAETAVVKIDAMHALARRLRHDVERSLALIDEAESLSIGQEPRYKKGCADSHFLR